MNARKVDDQVRRAELAAIHVAKRQLSLDDVTYRTMLFTLTRKRSAGDLDHAERQAVIEHLRKRGFVREDVKAAARADHGRPHGTKPSVPADRIALVNKIEALLADAARPWNYVRSMASRMFGLQLEWCSADQLRRLVAALEYDRQRRERKAKP
jgi:phage gp16-like protein